MPAVTRQRTGRGRGGGRGHGRGQGRGRGGRGRRAAAVAERHQHDPRQIADEEPVLELGELGLLTREKRRTHLRTPENLSWSQTNLGNPNHIKGRVHKIFWFPELFPPWKRFFNGWEYQRRPDLPSSLN